MKLSSRPDAELPPLVHLSAQNLLPHNFTDLRRAHRMFSFSHCGAILFRRLIERENFRARLHLFFHFGGVESDDLNDAYFGYSVLFQSIRLILGETRKREKKFFHRQFVVETMNGDRRAGPDGRLLRQDAVHVNVIVSVRS